MREKLQDVDGGPRATAPQRRPAPRGGKTRLVRGAKRFLLETAGWVLLLGGLVAIPLPGPGLLITFAGLLLLSRQYAWAERRVDWVRERALEGAVQSVATWPRLTMSIGGALSILAAGTVWVASPPAPTWWPLAETWWLPGGVVVGMTQLASAAIALALLGYSYRRFRGAPDGLSPVAAHFGGAGQPTRTAGSVADFAVVHQAEYLGEVYEVRCECPCATAA